MLYNMLATMYRRIYALPIAVTYTFLFVLYLKPAYVLADGNYKAKIIPLNASVYFVHINFERKSVEKHERINQMVYQRTSRKKN